MKSQLLFLLIMLLWLTSAAQEHDLHFYIEQARRNSPLIHRNENNKKIAMLDLEQIKRRLSRPEIGIDANVLFAPIISHDGNPSRFEWVSDGANSYNGYDQAITDGGQYQAFVSVRQPLFNGSKLETWADQTSVSQKINEENIKLTIHELNQTISQQYLLCLKLKQQSENTKNLLSELDQMKEIMGQLVENAVYSQTDQMLLNIEYRNYKLQYQNEYADFVNNLYDLNLLCGIDDTVIVDLQPVDFKIMPDSAVMSGFMRSYELDSLNIEAKQQIDAIKYKPSIDLFANAGLNAVYLPAFNRLGFSTGINFSWKLYDANQLKIQREKSNLQIKSLEFEKKQFISKIDLSKKKILDQINSLDQRIATLQEQIDAYDELYGVYQNEISQGNISVMDFKNLFKDLAAKKQESIQLKIQKQALINTYNYWNY